MRALLGVLGRRFAAWRPAIWLQKAKRALAKHDWWRNRAGDP